MFIIQVMSIYCFGVNWIKFWNFSLAWFNKWTLSYIVLMRISENVSLNSWNQPLYCSFVNIFVQKQLNSPVNIYKTFFIMVSSYNSQVPSMPIIQIETHNICLSLLFHINSVRSMNITELNSFLVGNLSFWIYNNQKFLNIVKITFPSPAQLILFLKYNVWWLYDKMDHSICFLLYSCWYFMSHTKHYK